MSDAVRVYFDEAAFDHDPGSHHVESASRIRSLVSTLHDQQLGYVEVLTPSAPSWEAVARVHHPAYIERVRALEGRSVALDPDTQLSPNSLSAIRGGVAAATAGIDALAKGEVRRAFSVMRPPGHHAEADRAMGFCIFNNCAVAAAHAVAAGFERVLVIDWDVHHGNGTQHAFYDRRDVLVFNVHQFPFYPGTGAMEEQGRGPGVGYTVNAPFPPGMGDADYARLFRELLVPVAESFAPSMVIVSAGFDGHREDPLGGMRVSGEGFAQLAKTARDIADRFAEGRLFLLLEGGYDPAAVRESALACLAIQHGDTGPETRHDYARGSDAHLRELLSCHRTHWKL